MNDIDRIIKQSFSKNADQKIDMSSQIMNKIKEYENKKENIRFNVFNYFLSFFIIILSFLSVYSFEILLPDFKLYLNMVKVNYLLIKFIFQGFFIFFIITVLIISLNNLLKSIKNFHFKIKNLIFLVK